MMRLTEEPYRAGATGNRSFPDGYDIVSVRVQNSHSFLAPVG